MVTVTLFQSQRVERSKYLLLGSREQLALYKGDQSMAAMILAFPLGPQHSQTGEEDVTTTILPTPPPHPPVLMSRRQLLCRSTSKALFTVRDLGITQPSTHVKSEIFHRLFWARSSRTRAWPKPTTTEEKLFELFGLVPWMICKLRLPLVWSLEWTPRRS